MTCVLGLRAAPVAVVPRLFYVRPCGYLRCAMASVEKSTTDARTSSYSSPPYSLEAAECAMLARMLGNVSITSSTRPQFRHLMASCLRVRAPDEGEPFPTVPTMRLAVHRVLPLRLSGYLGTATRHESAPGVHHLPALVKEVRSRVGSFSLGALHVRQ